MTTSRPEPQPTTQMLDQMTELFGFRPSDEQARAIAAPLEPSVIIAGAGTGKTTVMAARVTWLVANGLVRADQVLGLTFTRKATAELRTRVGNNLTKAGLLRPDDQEPTVLTYDSFAANLVSEFGAWIGVDPAARLISDARCTQVALDVLHDSEKVPPRAGQVTARSIAQDALSLSEKASSHGVSMDDIRAANDAWRHQLDQAAPNNKGNPYSDVIKAREAAEQRDQLMAYAQAYHDRLVERGFFRFSDRLNQAIQLVQDFPQIGQEIRSRYAVVLLDEYQDTSSSQAHLLASLFSGSTPEDGRGHAVTAVGDPLQAIYEWRGAAANNILDFPRTFPHAGEPDAYGNGQYSLTQNRRSNQVILDCANAISKSIRSDPRVGNVVKELRVPEDNYVGREESPLQTNMPVQVHTFDTWEQECETIADQIVEAHERGTVEQWKDIGVLLRTNAKISDLYLALTAREVPVCLANLSALLRVPDIALIHSHLRLLVDRRDNEALATLLTAPRWGLTTKELELLHKHAKAIALHREQPSDDIDPNAHPDVFLVDAVDDPGFIADEPHLARTIAGVKREMALIESSAADSPDDLVLRIAAVTGLNADIAADEPDRRDARRRHVDALWREVRQACLDDSTMGLTGVVEWMRIEDDEGKGLDRELVDLPDAVVIATVHAAKGLEWPMVFLPFMVDTVFPDNKSGDNFLTKSAVIPPQVRGDSKAIPLPVSGDHGALKKYTEELKKNARAAEDRLAYVAVTRAKSQLIVSWHKWTPGLKRIRRPSDYLTTIHDTIVAIQRQVLDQYPHDAPGRQQIVNRYEQIVASLDEEEVAVPTSSDLPAGRQWPQIANQDEVAARHLVTEWIAEGSDVALPALDNPDDADVADQWKHDAEVLINEERLRREHVEDLPTSLTTSQLMQIDQDYEAFLDRLRRPMPQPVSRGATVGSVFHEWVCHRLRPDLYPVWELAPGVSERTIQHLQDQFEASAWARLKPVEVEEPFALNLAGHVVRGRMDAIFADPQCDGGFIVVDWKTSRPGKADPIQLSVYRLAWAQALAISPNRVRALFHHVGDGVDAEPAQLWDTEELSRVLDSRS
ncbi:ATP-dependent DNA helicase [Cutibacterium granulosum]|uniref:ATP-dependent DNA helicase n=1 Tax=Cutibacterium granulosum TaxID=33011 RepID=UPI0027B8E255|nr:ATP-dependent DNA helicase [Cutibacterium granulosum]